MLLELHDEGLIPERVVHNDTKLNNVLFDRQTMKAVCVHLRWPHANRSW